MNIILSEPLSTIYFYLALHRPLSLPFLLPLPLPPPLLTLPPPPLPPPPPPFPPPPPPMLPPPMLSPFLLPPPYRRPCCPATAALATDVTTPTRVDRRIGLKELVAESTTRVPETESQVRRDRKRRCIGSDLQTGGHAAEEGPKIPPHTCQA